MGTKHTPGPWRIDVNGSEEWSVDYDGPSSTYMTICGARPQPVCFAVEPSAYGNDEEVEANARLIAAAPDLLDACLWLKVYAEVQVRRHPDAPDTPKWQSMLDAIAKATQP